MNPFVLVGFDLLISAALVLVAMYAVWTRVRTYLMNGAGGVGPQIDAQPGGEGGPEEDSAGDWPKEWKSGALTQEVTALTKQGCSVEETARRLQIPTREVETVLAISRMARTRGAGSYASAALAGANQGQAAQPTAR